MNAPLPEAVRKALESVTLDDKYALESGRAFMSGVQALVRLPMLQRKRDAMFGLNTAGFVSGYRGSPLGGYDQALWAAKKHLAAQNIVFQPGVNEELAATAVWGSQQLDLYPQSKKFDGVFGIWYGKGPGVDRCSDVFKHANMAGTVEARRRDRDRRRRPHRQELDRRAPERPHLQGLRPAGVLSVERAGHPRHGPACVRDEPLRRRLVGDEDDPGDRRVVGERLDRPGPGRHHPSRGLPHAGRRPAHPLARPAARAGSAADGLQVVRGARLRAREPAQPQRDRRAERPLRHHRQRQGLQRHAPGAARPRPRRRRLPPDRPAPAQGQRRLAARGDDHARLRRGPRGDPRRRGEAPGHRVPAEGRALRLARPTFARTCSASSTRARATAAAANGARPTRASTGCCARRPT